MDLTEIDDGVFVCGQITEDFVDELAKAVLHQNIFVNK